MTKKIYITETQFRKYLTEELSIAKEVIDISNEILSNIFQGYTEGQTQFIFDAPYNTKVNVKIYSFKNNHDFSNWLDNIEGNELYNGFSFKENTFYIVGIAIGGELETTAIENSVYHEVEHFVQSLKQGKPLQANKYDVISKNMLNTDPIVSTVCQILYYTTKFELDAFANGFYGEIRNSDLGSQTLSDIIDNSKECRKLLDSLLTWKAAVNKWTKTPFINHGRVKLFNLGIIKNIDMEVLKKQLIKRIDKSYSYLLKRIGKIYTFTKKEYDASINNSVNENNLLFHDGAFRARKINDTKILEDLNRIFEYGN